MTAGQLVELRALTAEAFACAVNLDRPDLFGRLLDRIDAIVDRDASRAKRTEAGWLADPYSPSLGSGRPVTGRLAAAADARLADDTRRRSSTCP